MLDSVVVVIGGGVVGLHVAIAVKDRRPGSTVIVCERERFVGSHTSSRNSQVLHAGFAYPPGSLKARLCVEGNARSYEWLRRLDVSHRRCGKWIVARSPQEVDALGKVVRAARACGVAAVAEATANQVAKAEPGCRRFAGALHSATSGVVDASEYLQALARYVQAQDGCSVLTSCNVLAIDPERRIIATTRGDVIYELLINASGLWADEIYHMCGGTRRLHIRPYRGEYCTWKNNAVGSMIYPVPSSFLNEADPLLVSHMGMHVHPSPEGILYVGPTQVEHPADRKADYEITTPIEEFVTAAQSFFEEPNAQDFAHAYAGNRPKLYEDGVPTGDFVILSDETHVHLLGIESPGLTAAPAIARYVADLIDLA